MLTAAGRVGSTLTWDLMFDDKEFQSHNATKRTSCFGWRIMISFSTSQTKAVLVRSRCWLAILLIAPLLVSCRKATQTVQAPAGGGGQMRPYAGQMEPDDGQWVRATKDYANTRYSTLDQINTGNVASLKVAWTFDTGVARGQEAAPIVANNTMYVVAPWPNKLFALDLTKPGGPIKWSYDPETSPNAKGEACCDWVNRGAVYADGKIIYNTLDG